MRWFGILLTIACSTENTVKATNTPPSIEIIDPITLTNIAEGSTLEFVAEGTDPNPGRLGLEAEWYADSEVICPWALLDEDDYSYCSITVATEDVDVSVSIRDTTGAGGSDFAVIKVMTRKAPEVEITSPENGTFYYQNQAVFINATVSDEEDAVETLHTTWKSDIADVLEEESIISPDGQLQYRDYLPIGEHVITLTVTDSDGRTASDTVSVVIRPPNSPPTCEIVEPQDGTAFLFGSLSHFLAQVDDIDIGPSGIVTDWSSNQNGLLGSSYPDSSGQVFFSRPNLARGAHTITMVAYDEEGESCTDSVNILIGSAPTIMIQTPADGTEFLQGQSISFAAQISDMEQSADTLSLVWSSDIQGVLHTNPANSAGSTSFSTELDPGWHVVTLEVTDEVGLSHFETVTVLINQKPDTPSVMIIPNNPRTGTTLSAVVSNLTDPDGQVPTVSYEWFKNGVPTPFGGASVHSQYTSKGDIWRVEVQSNDGSLLSGIAFAETEIENTPPNIDSISISPASGINSQSTVSCAAVASDPDENVSVSYIWKNQSTGATLGTSSSVTLQNLTASPGDTLRCTAQTVDSDGFVDTAYTEVYVGNRPPVLGSVAVSPVTSTTTQTLTCSITATDPDDQSLIYRYSWTHGSQTISTAQSIYLTPSWVQPGDTLTCTATARDPYGQEVSGSATSTVVNSGLIFEGVEIFPPNGVNNEGRLTCLITAYDPDGSTVSKSYSWKNMSTGQSLGTTNPLQLNPSKASVGDVIRCSGTVVDSSGVYTQNATVNVRNTRPSVDSVTITPSSSVFTSSLLTCSASYTDLDNETLSISYQWKNVATGVVLGTGSTLQLTSYISNPNDAITCQASVTDSRGATATGAESVVIQNQPPVATWAQITPSIGYVTDIFVGYGYGTDPDNDPVSLSYSWYVNNALYAVGTDRIGPGFPRGTKIILEVTPTDGHDVGTPLNSSLLVVRNTKPLAPQIRLAPTEPVETLDDLVCRISRGAYDADQDTITYNFKWFRNGGLWTGPVSTTAYPGDTIPAAQTNGWEEWRCEATPHDGYSSGISVLSNIVEVRIICDPDLGPNLTVSGIDFNCIAQAGFIMGSHSDEPGRDNDEDIHAVGLNQDYFMSVTEITQSQFLSVMGYNPSQWLGCGLNCPVDGVNWHMAVHFANSLSFLHGEEQCYTCTGTQNAVRCSVAIDPYECTGFRLPTEAEWEFAARSGSEYSFWTASGGADLQPELATSCMDTTELTDGTLPTDFAWFCTNHPIGSAPRTSPVASLLANGNGLYDMHGNLLEWCHDWYVASLGNTPVLNPSGPATGQSKVLRGGFWLSTPDEMRTSARISYSDTYQAQSSGIFGIRLAKTYFGQ